REVIGGFRQQLYRPPAWLVAAAIGTITVSYSTVAILAVLGLFLAPPQNRHAHWFLLLIIGAICAVHTVVFGHSRYHLPLIPILVLYGASAVHSKSWRHLFDGMGGAAGSLAAIGLLLAMWGREVLITDAGRIHELLRNLG